MARTNVVVDDRLIDEAVRLTGAKSKREAIDIALRGAGGGQGANRDGYGSDWHLGRDRGRVGELRFRSAVGRVVADGPRAHTGDSARRVHRWSPCQPPRSGKPLVCC